MALRCRINGNVFTLFGNSHCKFSTTVATFKKNNYGKVVEGNHQEKKRKELRQVQRLWSFVEETSTRRMQACRSILVQVRNRQSVGDLHNHCANFGTVLSMHHYQTLQNNHFILVELGNFDTLQNVLANSTFLDADYSMPISSPLLWFRDSRTYQQHSKNKSSNGIEVTSMQYKDYVDKNKFIEDALSGTATPSEQMLRLYNIYKLSDAEVRLRYHIAHQIEGYFSGLFPYSSVRPFGSTVNGFGKHMCDLDLVLRLQESRMENHRSRLVFHTKSVAHNERTQIQDVMKIMADAMQSVLPGITFVRKILQARVPIIKFHHVYTDLECDFSMSKNNTSIEMTELLSFYGEIDDRVRPLVFTLRKWAKCQQLTQETAGQWITNFSLTLMILFYLQQKKILPSIEKLHEYAAKISKLPGNNARTHFINEIETAQRLHDTTATLQDLLLGFFEFYSNFDFVSHAISLRKGVPIDKNDVETAIHICNPLEVSLNVSKNVSLRELNRIKHSMRLAIEALQDKENKERGIFPLFDEMHEDSSNQGNKSGIDVSILLTNNEEVEDDENAKNKECLESVLHPDVESNITTTNSDNNFPTKAEKETVLGQS